MSVVSISRSQRVLHLIIKETVQTANNATYSDLTPSHFDWLIQEWITLLDVLSKQPVQLYRGLVLANRCRPMGKLALVFNTILYTVVKNKSKSQLRSILLDVPFPEGESNPYLTDEQTISIKKFLRQEMQSLNLLLDQESHKHTDITRVLDHIAKCQKDVCLSPLGEMISSTQTELYTVPETDLIYVPDHPYRFYAVDDEGKEYCGCEEEEADVTIVGCFNLLDLLGMILYDLDNPYTSRPLSESTRDLLLSRYEIELSIFRYSNELITTLK